MLHTVGVQDGQAAPGKAITLADGLLDAGAGSAHQHQRLDVSENLRGQRLIGDLFVVAARDQDDLLVKAAQTRNRARGAGRDGVIVVGHAVQRADRLNAVLDAGEGRADLTHGLDGHAAPDGGAGGQQVFHIVEAAQLNLLAGQDRRHNAVLGIAERIVALAQERAPVGLVQAGEPNLLALAVLLHTAGDVVLKAQHGTAGRGLPQQNVALGVDVLLHILVVVEVVGGHVRDDGHLRAAAHADELEAGQLDDGHGVGGHVGQLGQERRTDVAAQKDLAARSLEHLGDQRRRRGLAIGAGHGHDLAGAKLKEELHLARDHCTGFQRSLQFGLVVLIARRAHDDVLPGEAVGIMLAQTQIHLQAAQRVGVVTEVVQALFLVAERDLRAQLDKLLNAALVADARTDKGNLFALNKLLQLLDRQHKYLSSGVVSTSIIYKMPYFCNKIRPAKADRRKIMITARRPWGCRACPAGCGSWSSGQ